MKQTAVEWLLNEFQEIHKDYGGLDLEWLKRFEQAKETEKQQIIDARVNGVAEGIDIGGNPITENISNNHEKYYTETYGNSRIKNFM